MRHFKKIILPLFLFSVFTQHMFAAGSKIWIFKKPVPVIGYPTKEANLVYEYARKLEAQVYSLEGKFKKIIRTKDEKIFELQRNNARLQATLDKLRPPMVQKINYEKGEYVLMVNNPYSNSMNDDHRIAIVETVHPNSIRVLSHGDFKAKPKLLAKNEVIKGSYSYQGLEAGQKVCVDEKEGVLKKIIIEEGKAIIEFDDAFVSDFRSMRNAKPFDRLEVVALNDIYLL